MRTGPPLWHSNGSLRSWPFNVTALVGAINSGLRFAGPPRQFGIRLMKVF